MLIILIVKQRDDGEMCVFIAIGDLYFVMVKLTYVINNIYNVLYIIKSAYVKKF